jgi:hypothetical protein
METKTFQAGGRVHTKAFTKKKGKYNDTNHEDKLQEW